MRTLLRLCAAAAAVALGGSYASACDRDRGYGYNGCNGHAPPAYVHYAPPPYMYAPPPPYGYYGPRVSYYAPTAFAYGYYAPVVVYRGPRWAHGHARYYTAPVVYGGPWRRSWSYRGHAGPRFYRPPCRYARPCHVSARGPVVRTWRRW
jgi:hypothetical protein